VLILLLISGYWFFLSPTRIAHMARVELERITGADVTIGSARLDLSGIIHLRDVAIRARGLDGEGAELFTTDDIVLVCDRPQLWQGEVKPIAIRMRRPTITLAEVVPPDGQPLPAGQPTFNWQYIQPPDRAIETEQWPELPRIDIEEALFRYGEIHGSAFRPKGNVELRGQVIADANKTGLFHLTMVELNGVAPRPDGLHLTGSIDINASIAQAQIKNLGLDDRYRTLLPRMARRIWDSVEPTGTLPKLQFAYDPKNLWRAEVNFDHVTMRLPELPGAEKRFRLEDGKGAIRFDPNRISIIEPLVGKVEGLAYEIEGTVHGYSAEAPFEIGLHTEPFDIPVKYRAIYAMPEPVQEVFRLLTPSGKLNRVTMKIWREAGRAGQPGKVDYQGTARIVEARAMHRRFPYELQHCRGRVLFNSEEIRVLSLVGKTLSGGNATIAGQIGTSIDAPGVDLEIVAVDVPIDKHLYKAMRALEPEYREALDLFFNKPAYQRMADEGHFISADQYNELEQRARQIERRMEKVDPLLDRQLLAELKAELAKITPMLEREVFDLGGRANMVIHVTRKPTVEDFTTAAADIELLPGTGIVFEHFPYPLRIESGRMSVRDGELAFANVKARGLTKGQWGVTGKVYLPDDDDEDVFEDDPPPADDKDADGESAITFDDIRPDLDVWASGIEVDELLLDSLPKPQDKWVRDLNVTGTLDVKGRIFRDVDEKSPDVNLEITIDNAQANPGGGELVMKKLGGKIHLSLGDVRFEQVSGMLGDRKIQFDGMASWAPDAQVIDLTAKTQAMQFNKSLIDLVRPYVTVDPAWEAFIDKRKPTGEFDATLTFRQTGEDQAEALVELSPRSVSFMSDDQRVSITEGQGSIRIRPGQIEFDQLQGMVGGAKFAIEGDVTLGDQTTADLSLKASGDSVTDELLAAMPKGVRSLVDAMGIQGPFNADLKRVRLTPGADDGKLVKTIAGQISTTNGKADLGVAMDNINAVVDLMVTAVDGQKHPRVNAKVKAKQFNLRGRKITDVTGTLKSVGDTDVLAMSDMRGRIYEGVVAGEGKLWLDRERFELRLALSDVQLETFLYKGEKPEKEAEMTGDLTASFNVEGSWAKNGKVRGRGQIQVRKGNMYELPLALGLLHVTHLSLPTTKSFERADVSYYVKDGKIVFEKIALEAPHMRLAGEGSMLIKNEALDITLTSSNPSGLDLGPVTDMVDAVRDQLVTVRVTGTMDNPKREVRQFNGLTKAWEDVFGKDDTPN
jgi:hypothetical protein